MNSAFNITNILPVFSISAIYVKVVDETDTIFHELPPSLPHLTMQQIVTVLMAVISTHAWSLLTLQSMHSTKSNITPTRINFNPLKQNFGRFIVYIIEIGL